jgi:hypothetical protein
MRQVEIRDQCDDFEEVAAFWRRVWSSEYSGRTWVVLPDATFFQWLLGPGSGAFCHLAYREGRLAGLVCSIPHGMRIGPILHASGSVFGLTVDPAHRGLALPLVERLRRHNAERGVRLVFGLIVKDPSSPSNLFWTGYGNAFPDNLRFLFPLTYWIKALAPSQVAQACIDRWERLGTRAFGTVLSAVPTRRDPHVRLYRSADLEGCVRLVERSWASLDWAQQWTAEQLRRRLEGPSGGTLVLERDGCLRAMVNYHCLTMLGRKTVRGAAIALWADEGIGGGEQARLLGEVCRHLRERDVQVVTAVSSGMMPRRAFFANLFVQAPAPWHLATIWTSGAMPLPPPGRWGLVPM